VLEGAPLQSVDPGGVIAAAMPVEQVIGCVVHASTPRPSRAWCSTRWARA
jgi:2-dehydropantoate 2-reductase